VAESTNPAVQAVVSEYRGTVSQRDWQLTPAFFSLFGTAVAQARAGAIGANVTAVTEYVFTRVRRSPGSYFAPTSTVRQKSYVLRTGRQRLRPHPGRRARHRRGTW
jgi:hypothetical protein